MNTLRIPVHRPLRTLYDHRGEGRLKAIIWTVILVLVGYTCYKIVPIYVAEYQLQDKMQETARYASALRQTDEQIRDAVFREIQDLNIPVRREAIKIENIESNGRRVRISVDYTTPLDLFFYHTDLHFTPTSENKSLT